MNYIIIMGRIGQDLELKTSQSGMSFLNLSVATSSKYKDKEDTQWHKCVAFGKTAEFISQWFGKGRMIGLSGELKYEKYVDKQDVERIAAKIHVRQAHFTGEPKSDGGGQSAGGSSQAKAAGHGAPAAGGDNFGDMEDIPF